MREEAGPAAAAAAARAAERVGAAGKRHTHVLEGLRVGRVVHDDDTVSPTVVAAGDGAEALLARSVPNLQLDGLTLELDGADFLKGRDGVGGARQQRRTACGGMVESAAAAASLRGTPAVIASSAVFSHVSAARMATRLAKKSAASKLGTWAEAGSGSWLAAMLARTHKVDANRGDVALRVGVIGKAQQEAGLADARIADEDELENVIVLLRGE